MKRFINLVFVFLGTVVITASCGPKDKNVPIVNKAFKAYVQKTFDDPNSLKEIVEIVPHDTISMESIKALVKITNDGIEQYRELWRLKDSVNTEQMQAVLKGPKPKRQPTYSESLKGNMLINEGYSLTVKIVEAKIALYPLQSRLNELGDRLVYHPAIYVYEVKYRNQYSDGLKLESAYAYIDSLAGFKVILPKKDDSEIISEDYHSVFKLSKECLIALNTVQELYEKQRNNWDELMELTKRF